MKSKPNLFRRVYKSALVPSFTVICIGASTLAVQGADWLTTGTTDWNTASNWSTGRVPVKTGFNDQAVINTNTGSICTIIANISATPTDILVGSGGGTNGRVNHISGTAQSGSGNWVKVGNNGGTGVYNLANTAVTGSGISGFTQGTGSLTAAGGGQLRVGAGDNGTNNTGTFNMNTTGSVTAGQLRVGATSGGNGRFNLESGTVNSGDVYVGDANVGGSGRLDVSSGSVVSGGWVKIGHNGGIGAINLANTGGTGGTLTGFGQGAGSLSTTGNLRIGGGDAGSGGSGTFNVNTTGTLTSTGPLHVGTQASTGVMNFDSGTIAANNSFFIGNAVSATGTVNMSGGTLNKTNNATAFAVGNGGTGTLGQTNGAITVNGEFWVGSTSGGTYTMSGGTLSTDSWFVVGRNGSGVGTITMSGGTITKGGANDLVVGADSATANGTISQSAGLINVTAGSTNIGKNAGTGTLTLSSTADFRTIQMVVGAGTGIGTVNLNGGTLETPKLNGGGGTSTVHFNGGTLQATADSVTFVSGLGTADILAGGALLDTQAFAETASQVFSGTGTLTKLGSGTLALTGDSTHTGLTLVSDGKLIANTRSTLTAGGFSVANGKTLGVTRRFAEESLNAASLTLGTSASTATLEMNLGNFGNPLTGATLRVAGALTVNANTTINVTDTFPEEGSFPMIQFGSRSGAGTFTLGTLPPGVVAHLDETIDPNEIYLVITQAKLLEWDDSELAGGVWDTSNTNWNDLLANAPAVFTTGAPVSFLDIGTVDSTNPPNPNVVIAAGGVSPGTVTFNNTAVNYAISGTGGINGTTSLLKQGTGSVTIATSNAYTGVTRLEAGTLNVSSIANAGSPSGIGASAASAANLVFAGGKLSYTGSGDTTDRGFTIAANSVFDVQGALTMSGGITASAGALTKSGAGVLTLNNPGANVLAATAALRVDEGGLILEGGGTQTNPLTGEVYVGTTLAATANLVLNNTSLTTGGGNYLAIARGSGTPGHVSNVTFNNSTVATGNLSLGYDNGVAGYSATSVLTLNNSAYTTGFSKIGESAGATASLVLNGSSMMTAGNTDVAQSNGATGTLDIKGTSVYTSNNAIQVGRDAGANGTIIIENSGRIVTPTYVSVGFGGTGSLTVKDSGVFAIGNDFSVNESGAAPANVTLQDSGTITVGGVTFVGRNATRVGTLTQTGGTYTGNGGEFRIGSSGTGTWLQSGGVTNAGGWVSIGRETAGTGVLTVSGTAAFNQTGAGNALIVGENGSGTLNIQGTATVSSMGTGGVVVTRAGGNGTVNLDGGTLVAVKVVEDGGTSTFNFNGGVLKAGTGAAATFLTGIDTAMVKVGGANIDSNGNNIALNQNFTNDSSSGNFTKIGAGTVFVNGSIGILGQAHISAGTLSGTGYFDCALFVDGASNLNPGGETPGTLTAASTTFAATSTMTIDLSATQDALVTGDLVLNGATLALNGTATEPVYVIAEYTSLPGGATGKFAGGMSPGALPPGYTIDYAYAGGTQIALVQTATPYSTWAGGYGLDPLTDGAPGFDKDGDGQINLLEFALGGSPISGSDNARTFSLVADSNDGGSANELLLTIAVRVGTPAFSGGASPTVTQDGFTYAIEGSTTLNGFGTTVAPVAVVVPPAPNATPPSGYEYRTFSLIGSNGMPGKGFLRVKVSN